jgi:hypothetical protein
MKSNIRQHLDKMANQSLIAVPANVEDPIVLQRFLSRLVEEMDVVIGNRSGPAEGYVSQQQLIESAATLTELLGTAQTDLGQALARLGDLDELVVENLAEQLTALEEKNAEQDSKIATLGNAAVIKGAMLSFGANGTSDPTMQVNFNINAIATRVSAGLYEFDLVQLTFEGIDVLANSVLTLAWAIQPSATSESFNVVYVTTATPGKFRLQVNIIEQGTGNKLVITPYDLISGDRVDVSALFTVPGATLPGGL